MSDSDALITKRLHVSGLTPTLTADDLNIRLSSFGPVKVLDGYGLLDGLGQPRKFGYITIETTPAKPAKCKLQCVMRGCLSNLSSHWIRSEKLTQKGIITQAKSRQRYNVSVRDAAV
jgi:hypothetical protein